MNVNAFFHVSWINLFLCSANGIIAIVTEMEDFMDNILGKRIKALRLEINLNQSEFANILNIRNTTLS